MTHKCKRGTPIPPIESRGIISVGEYLRKKYDREQRLWRYKDGVMLCQHEGWWITETEFNKLYPPITVMDFTANANNCDTTKLWML